MIVRRLRRGFRLFLFAVPLGFIALPAGADAVENVSAVIEPSTIHLGETATVTLNIRSPGRLSLSLPYVPGLIVVTTQTSTFTTITDTGRSSSSQVSFLVAATHPGTYTIPAFDFNIADGGSLHVDALHLQVLPATGTTPQATAPPAVALPPSLVIGPPIPGATGPVIMPPNGPPTPNAAGPIPDAAPPAPSSIAPTGPDGTPAKVFIVVTPETTHAYVGQAVLLKIEFYIRSDSDYQQNSLPTIKGSDFLMTQLGIRPQEESYIDGGVTPYRRETWMTAITATRAGDFPFQMERDTYWTKDPDTMASNPFGAFFHVKPELNHRLVASNAFTLQIKPLPTADRPPSFSGAIGQFRATVEAAPDHLTVGEPASLHFTITGKGNFDYVKCPVLAPSTVWKSYQPQARTTYDDEAHTQGTKEFEQAIIPSQAGTLPLLAAAFSYFDPVSEHYFSLPLPLPTIQVFGGAAATLAAGPTGTPDLATTSASAPPVAPTQMAPVRAEFGLMQTDLRPIFWRRWFWAIQALLVALVLAGLFMINLPAGLRRATAARRRRRESERQRRHQEAALHRALALNDPPAFFTQARALVQTQLGGVWHLPPGAIDLATISDHDPRLAEMLGPLFAEADRTRFSGRTNGAHGLSEWQQRWPEIEEALPKPKVTRGTPVGAK